MRIAPAPEETTVPDASPTPATTVGDIVAGDYRTAAVFERHGIDFCCGGDVTLAAACAEHRLDPAVLEGELKAARSTPARQDADYASWTLTRLIDHIKAVHHAYLRANTAQTAAYARKIADVHGDHHPELARIADAFAAMATELMAHLEEEEDVVFPAIKRAEAAGRAASAPEAADAETIARGVQVLVREHEQVGAALREHPRSGHGLRPAGRRLRHLRAHLPAPAGVRGRPPQARPPREQHPLPARDRAVHLKERPLELREEIDPGICGYTVAVTARTEDARHVEFTIDSDCEILAEFAKRIAEISPVDAIQSLSPEENPILAQARELLRTTGCCEACVVPIGTVKAMYIVANLALARDVSLKLTDK